MLAFNAFKDCFLDIADEPEVDEEAVTEANEDVDTATAAPEPEPPEVVLIEGVVDKLKLVAPVVGVAWALLPGFLAPNNSSASVALSC